MSLTLQFLISLGQIWHISDRRHFLYTSWINSIEIWPMSNMGHFLYNFLWDSLEYDLWHVDAISSTLPYPIHWNMTYDGWRPFPPHLLLEFIEVWPMNNTWRFPLQCLIRFIEISSMTYGCHFLYNSLSHLFKYNIHRVDSISSTIPYQLHWSMAYEQHVAFSLQFLIRFIEIWPMPHRCPFVQNFLSHSLNYDKRWIEGIPSTSPYEVHGNMRYEVQVIFSSTHYQLH